MIVTLYALTFLLTAIPVVGLTLTIFRRLA